MAEESKEKATISDIPAAEQVILSHLSMAAGSTLQLRDIIAVRELHQHSHELDPAQFAEALVRLLPSLQDVRGEPFRRSLRSLLSQDLCCQVFQRPPKNPQHLNRPELLIQLAEALKTQHGTVISQGITGLGGVGKTQLAQALVHAIIESKAIEDIPIRYDHILWLNAEISLGEQFQVFARKHCHIESSTVDEAVRAVYAFLRGKNTLIIFDNAEPISLASYLPPSDYQSPLHLLITSRNPHWGEAVHTLKLNGFTWAETEAFVTKILGEQDPVAVRALHDTLGNISNGEMFVLPLALTHALAYIKAGHCTLAEYPVLFRQGIDPSRSPDPIFSDEESINDPHPKTVGTTISLSLAQARLKAHLAERLLCLTAYLAPDNIPVEFLAVNLPEETVVSIQQAIEALEAYSLITYDESKKCINVHRLVQATMRHVYKKECNNQLVPLIDRLIERSQYDEKNMKALTAAHAYLPHVLTCVAFASEADFVDLSRLILLLRMGGEIALYNMGDALQGKLIYEKALQLQRRLSLEENTDLAFILESLGNAYGELGETTQQKELLQQALEMFERHYGSRHLTVASSSMNLGCACYAAGDSEEARKHLERALDIFEEDEEINVGWIAVALMNLSNTMDDLTQQERMLSRALRIQRKIYGDDHPRIAGTMMNLANIQGKLGDVEGQVRALERVLKIQKQYYGEKHPMVARTRVNLGNAYGALGKMEGNGKLLCEKKELLEEALKIQQSCYGENYFEMGITLFNLTVVCLELDLRDEATLHVRRACIIFKKYFGESSAQAKTAEELLRCCVEADPSILGSGIRAFTDMREGYECVWMRLRSFIPEFIVLHSIDDARKYRLERTEILSEKAEKSASILHLVPKTVQKDFSEPYVSTGLNASQKIAAKRTIQGRDSTELPKFYRRGFADMRIAARSTSAYHHFHSFKDYSSPRDPLSKTRKEQLIELGRIIPLRVDSPPSPASPDAFFTHPGPARAVTLDAGPAPGAVAAPVPDVRSAEIDNTVVDEPAASAEREDEENSDSFSFSSSS